VTGRNDFSGAEWPLGYRIFATAGIALTALGVAWLLWAAGQAREAARRTTCKGRFSYLALALQNYHDLHGSFPPAVTYGPDGQPWHSWRVLILPQLEEKTLFDRYRFDEPWDGSHNRQLADEFPSLPEYRCMSDTPGDSCSYFAVTGQRTLWPPDESLTLTPEDIPDGPSNTLHVVEVSESGVHWMEPRDLLIDRMNFGINQSAGVGIRSRHPVGANVSFGDGHVATLPVETAPENVKSMLVRDDGGPTEVP